jgi:hypothetical protein
MIEHEEGNGRRSWLHRSIGLLGINGQLKCFLVSIRRGVVRCIRQKVRTHELHSLVRDATV